MIAASFWSAIRTSRFLLPCLRTPATALMDFLDSPPAVKRWTGDKRRSASGFKGRRCAHPRRSASTFTTTLRSNEHLRSAQLRRVNDVQHASRILIHTLAAEAPGSSLHWSRMHLLWCKRAAPEGSLMKFA